MYVEMLVVTNDTIFLADTGKKKLSLQQVSAIHADGYGFGFSNGICAGSWYGGTYCAELLCANHIEGSRLTKEQTRYIFETNTIGITDKANIIETTNHFRCIDFIIDRATEPLTESMIKQLHGILKSGTTDASKSWFAG